MNNQMKEIPIGSTICAHTHAEFLNQLLGLKLQGYQKCSYPFRTGNASEVLAIYDANGTDISRMYRGMTIVWMVWVDGRERNGWENRWVNGVNGKDLEEKYVGDGTFAPGEPLYRLVFEIISVGRTRTYVYRGLYRAEDNPTEGVRINTLVKDVRLMGMS